MSVTEWRPDCAAVGGSCPRGEVSRSLGVLAVVVVCNVPVIMTSLASKWLWTLVKLCVVLCRRWGPLLRLSVARDAWGGAVALPVPCALKPQQAIGERASSAMSAVVFG